MARRSMTAAEKALWDAHPDAEFPRFEIRYDHGHLLYRVDRDSPYVYADTGQPHDAGPPRPCAACGREVADDTPDPCIGTLPGVAFACCGHGVPGLGYVTFDDGTTLRGFGSGDVETVMLRTGIPAKLTDAERRVMAENADCAFLLMFHVHGHLTYKTLRDAPFVYADTRTPVDASPPRACAACGAMAERGKPDPCLPFLPGVRHACCGHGVRDCAYVMFENGARIGRFDTPGT